jgi:nucleotide-binding universal stress UspA family protein
MIKTILVPATADKTDDRAYAAASALVRAFDAHIDALHVRVDPVAVAVNTMADGGAGGTLLQGLINDLEQEIRHREVAAHRKFAEFCAREGIPVIAEPTGAPAIRSAQWHAETGDQSRWMATYGMTADLIVVPRGTPSDEGDARATLEAVLIEAGRPLLIPSDSASPLAIADRVAIAWKPTPQAARAVAAAMPFLTRAKEIVVMTVEEEEGRHDAADRLVSSLGWHGLNAVAQRLKPGSHGGAETLLAAAADQTGLLVMGGYGHSRLREWVFGGFTQRVLSEAPMPVLIAH